MKAKTHSGTKKRVKITATGKFRTAKIGKRHLLQNKSSKAKGRGKYGAATHVANERKMKWGHKVAGLRTPAKKTADGKIVKTPRLAPTIKAVTPKKVVAKKTKDTAPKSVTKKSAPKKK
jgi:large subunit ribosomal protein L35